MKIITLHGSARRNGDTDTLAEHLLHGLQEHVDCDVAHFYPSEMSIEHCRACMACLSGDGCIIHDDMQQVYPVFSQADVVIMATPMFWGYMTSQLKALFDRLEAIAASKHFGNKDFVLLMGYRHYYGSMIEWLDRITLAFGSRAHAIACQTFDPKTGEDIPIVNLSERLQETLELGRTIAESRHLNES